MKIVIKKYLKVTGIVIASLIAFLLIVTLVINFLFKDQLIGVVKNQLNNQLDAKVSISKIDLSLWRHFPNVSVQFDDVNAQSSNKFLAVNQLASDTFLIADKLFFEFNLFKLLNSKYELKRVDIKNGYIKLKVDKNGNLNYEIIKPGEKKSEGEFNLELKNLLLTNSRIEYINQEGSVRISAKADKLKLKGDFKSKVFDLDIYSNMVLNELTINNYSYIIDKPTQLYLNLFINDTEYQIRESRVIINKLDLLTGGYIKLGKTRSIELKTVGKNLNFGQIVETLPPQLKKEFEGYKTKGKVNLDFKVDGSLESGKNPNLNLGFTVRNGYFLHQGSGIELKDMDLTGSFNSKNSNSTFKVGAITFKLGAGKVAGNCFYEKKIQSSFKVNLNYELNLIELKKFFNLDTIENLSGSVNGNISLAGNYRSKPKFSLSDVSNLESSGKMSLKDVNVKVKNSEYEFNRITGDVDVSNNLDFNNIVLYVHDNDFLINGSLQNWADYLLKRSSDITLKADITTRNLDLSKYFVENPKSTKSEYSRELLFPENINLEVKLKVNNFKLNKFNAKWASGFLSYKPKMFILKSITFQTMDGRVTGNGVISQDISKNFVVKGQVDIAKLDIKQMFYTFDNFSQKILLDRHLQGKVSGKISISSEWNNALYLNKDKLLVDADITIENGELKNFEPMRSLSRFIALKELENIKFSTLKNNIYIKDKQIVIPQMDVYSSAFNITASGVHLFDNHYNYKIKVLLSDILWGKAKHAKSENEEFGAVEDDGLGKTSIPLSITGFNSDYKITYDSKKAIEVVKQSFKNQKKELRSALNEEFGWFKNDSTIRKQQETKNRSRFKVEWDNEDTKTTPKEKSGKDKKKEDDQKQMIEWNN